MGHAVHGLREAVAALRELGVEGLVSTSGTELVELARDLHQLSDSVRAFATAATAVVDENDLVRAAGHASTSRWLAAQAGMSSRAASATVAAARSLSEHPSTASAWLAGQVPEASVREIARGVARATRGLTGEAAATQAARCEAVLLHVARTRTPDDVRRAAQALRVEVDPAGAEAAALAAHAEQYLRLTPDPDGVFVEGRLTHDAAAALVTALDRVVDGYHRTGGLVRGELLALSSRQLQRRRTARDHLRARALGDLVGVALGEGRLGHHHDVRPHVAYTVHDDDLAAGRGGRLLMPGHGEIALPTASIERVPCDAEIHPVLTRGAAERHTLDPSGARGWDGATAPPLPALLAGAFDTPPPIETQVDQLGLLDHDCLESWGRRLAGERGRHVLDLGRAFRTAPPDLRRALEVRDRCCVFPECRVDPSRCEAHHVVHWRHGGATSLSNMALLCPAHHHAVHEGGWNLYARPGVASGEPQRWAVEPPADRWAGAAVAA